MPIQNLKVQGFRSLKDIDWTPGQLNVVIGPNASGKSNLLKLLKMITASAQGKLGKYVDRSGGIQSILWDGLSETIQCKLCSSIYKNGQFEVGYRYNIDLKPKHTADYTIDKELLSYKEDEKSTEYHIAIVREHDRFSMNDKQEKLTKISEDISPYESMLSLVNLANSSFITLIYNKYINSWNIFHDIDVSSKSELRSPVITRYEPKLQSDGNNFINVLHTHYYENRQFREDINNAMGAAFGEDFEEISFPPAADQRIQMRLQWKSLSKSRSSADLSDGTLRFLILLTILANPEPTPLIAIDEPETGLHPSMFPIIAEFAQEASRKSQIIFTTHSPEFLDAFRDELPTVTVTQWENGQTQLRTIDGDELKKWINDYSLGRLYSTRELEVIE